MIHSNKIKIALSGLPDNDWWGSGISAYKDNDMMADGVTPNQELVCSEHNNLKHAIVLLKQYFLSRVMYKKNVHFLSGHNQNPSD